MCKCLVFSMAFWQARCKYHRSRSVARAHLTGACCASADIVPQQVTIASLLQQVQREDALDLANGAPPPLAVAFVVSFGQGACGSASSEAARALRLPRSLDSARWGVSAVAHRSLVETFSVNSSHRY